MKKKKHMFIRMKPQLQKTHKTLKFTLFLSLSEGQQGRGEQQSTTGEPEPTILMTEEPYAVTMATKDLSGV